MINFVLIFHIRESLYFMEIKNRRIGLDEPVYFIAEIGLNHNGDMNLAEKMIEAAHRTGAEAVKFQTFKAEKLADPVRNPELFAIFKKSELDKEQHIYLRDIAHGNDLAFISTPFDEESVEMLFSCGVDAFKVASGDLTNYPLLRKIADYRLPVIMSTGMGFMEEVIEAMGVLEKHGSKFVLPLHCISSYPPDESELNLRSILRMREILNRPIGYSDHYIGDLAVVTSVVLGAVLIEKHFTIDKNLDGPDQSLSADEGDLRTIIRKIRMIEMMLGDGIKKPSAKEEKTRMSGRQGIYAAKDITPGRKITRDDVVIARPQGETPASHIDKVIGSHASKHIKAGSSISLKSLKSRSEVTVDF
jgi:N,N'-diacetyllegionaminate synthase